jgi:hypothetical protein
MVQANYLDALNASHVRNHRQKPKALGLKFGCGFTRHLFPKVLRLRDIDLLEAALLPRSLIRSTTSARASKRWRGDRMSRRLP